ncbi:MAG: TrmH family RNA methyltransferase, partial [Caulobacteraceae bacterium]
MNAAAPCVILSEPQLAQNIGAAARVMANFGLEDLRLVRPRDGWPQKRAWAAASGAHWPLDGARVFARLEEAVADLRLVLATTARPRGAALPVLTPTQGAARLAAAAGEGLAAGLLFGGERAGLGRNDLALCQAIVTVSVDVRSSSPNIAQEVAVDAYK